MKQKNKQNQNQPPLWGKNVIEKLMQIMLGIVKRAYIDGICIKQLYVSENKS